MLILFKAIVNANQRMKIKKPGNCDYIIYQAICKLSSSKSLKLQDLCYSFCDILQNSFQAEKESQYGYYL